VSLKTWKRYAYKFFAYFLETWKNILSTIVFVNDFVYVVTLFWFCKFMLILKRYIILQKDALGKAADDAATPVVKALLRLREIFPELILACDVSIC
jgi:hypothetical protein